MAVCGRNSLEARFDLDEGVQGRRRYEADIGLSCKTTGSERVEITFYKTFSSPPCVRVCLTPYAYDEKTPKLAQGRGFLRSLKETQRKTEETTRNSKVLFLVTNLLIPFLGPGGFLAITGDHGHL